MQVSKIGVITPALLALIFLSLMQSLSAQEDVRPEDLVDVSFDELMNTKVKSASGVEERLRDAPSAMIVVTADDIKKRGYVSLVEVLSDLPGFDIIIPNGAYYMVGYQRGYRTPFTQRTLVMVDGKVDNHLWTHIANVSRQYSMNNIEKVEIMYGPASAVYGANAFLGVVNIITKSGQGMKQGANRTSLTSSYGSFDTKVIDLSSVGNVKGVGYSISARLFKSDEADLSDRWGFLSNDKFSNTNFWGPILDIENNGKKLGSYYDPSDNYSTSVKLDYKGLRLGMMNWKISEGYGMQYPSDRSQNNGRWDKTSSQFYVEYDKDLAKNLRMVSSMIYHRNTQGGDWCEATPDWNEAMEDYSYISLSYWNAFAESFHSKLNFDYDFSENLLLSAGLRYERKKLTKAYDVSGYWSGSYTSSMPANETGPYGQGAGIGHSQDDSYVVMPPPNPVMPAENLTYTEDVGGFVQGIYDLKKFRFHAGIRVDDNSVYGASINPRVSVNYEMTEKSNFKLIYGEAFQEPPPVMLWGGWSGRNANPDLKPEKVRNLEAIAMYQTGSVFYDISLFHAWYNNVIKEEAENAGERTIFGMEYRIKFKVKNPIKRSKAIRGFFNYTYTRATSYIIFNGDTSDWEEGEALIGDIAPHKFQAGVDFPVRKHVNVYLNGIYSSRKELYLRNPLRLRGEELKGYLVVNTNLTYNINKVTFGLKVNNLLDAEYFHSGVESASAGDDFGARSLGWHNSLLPQPGRSFLFSLIVNID